VSITGRDPEGCYTLSTIKVERPKDWSTLERAFAEKRAIGGVVTELVRADCAWMSARRRSCPLRAAGRRIKAELEKLVGQEIQCRIIKLDTAAKTSWWIARRDPGRERPGRASEILGSSKKALGCAAPFAALTDFGAFVFFRLGGVDGLLHVATGMASRGEAVRCGDGGRFHRSQDFSNQTRRQRIFPGAEATGGRSVDHGGRTVHTGDRVQGKVSRLADFGAFVELFAGRDGLIHISEMSLGEEGQEAERSAEDGEMVEAVVLGVNAGRSPDFTGSEQALADPWKTR